MGAILSQRIYTSQRKRRCDAYDCITANGDWREWLKPEEIQEVERVAAQGGFILPGQKYFRQVGIADGDFSVYCADPALDRITRQYDMWG